MSDTARLEVNSVEYGGWTSVRVTRGIETIAGSFSLKVSEKWASGPVGPSWPILEYDQCVVKLGDDVLITGFVDRRTHEYDAGQHTLGVEGRDATGNLVDCSAIVPGRPEFNGVGVMEVAIALCSPFNIGVTLQNGIDDKAIGASKAPSPKAPGGRPEAVGTAGKSSSMKIGRPNLKLTIDPGKSAFELLDEGCRQVGVLPVSDSLGGLVLTRTGGAKCTTALVKGGNILRASATYDGSKRYRRVLVYGQSQGTDDGFGSVAAAPQGQPGIDLAVPEERVLIVLPEQASRPDFATVRAAWEATVRKARGRTVDITVQGWRQGDGTLWPINALVDVKDPTLGIDGQMLIKEATYEQSVEQGTTTTLSLCATDAYIPEPTLTDASNVTPWKELVGGA